MIDRNMVYEMLDKENAYAHGWAKGKEADHISRDTGVPFSMMDWLIFTEKYLAEAKLAYANYCPDLGAIRIRFIKAASLLVTALQCHGQYEDLERLAGVSSSKFPILGGGLATFNALTDDLGNLEQDYPR